METETNKSTYDETEKEKKTGAYFCHFFICVYCLLIYLIWYAEIATKKARQSIDAPMRKNTDKSTHEETEKEKKNGAYFCYFFICIYCLLIFGLICRNNHEKGATIIGCPHTTKYKNHWKHAKTCKIYQVTKKITFNDIYEN